MAFNLPNLFQSLAINPVAGDINLAALNEGLQNLALRPVRPAEAAPPPQTTEQNSTADDEVPSHFGDEQAKTRELRTRPAVLHKRSRFAAKKAAARNPRPPPPPASFQWCRVCGLPAAYCLSCLGVRRAQDPILGFVGYGLGNPAGPVGGYPVWYIHPAAGVYVPPFIYEDEVARFDFAEMRTEIPGRLEAEMLWLSWAGL